MISFSKKEIREISNIHLHDAEISKIICDYDNGTIEMPIVMAEKHEYAAFLRFEKIVHVEINHKEPWGMGINIFEVNVEDDEDDYFKVSILLNSGDEVSIIASKMIYSVSE